MSASGIAPFTGAECEFLSEDEIVTVTPNFRMDSLRLMGVQLLTLRDSDTVRVFGAHLFQGYRHVFRYGLQ